jgi:hypothetical integral membrane protein (TIGR02206 family)
MQPGFQLFGTPHLVTLVLIVASALLLPLAVRFWRRSAARPVAHVLATLLLVQEGVQLLLEAKRAGLSVELLPLQLCTMAVYLTAWMLISRAARVYEVVYFWGLGGSTQALVTPDLAQGFPAPAYLLFFLGHGLVIVGVLYGAIVFRLRPYPASILRVIALTLAAAAAVFFVNLWLGTNFMYLMAKPTHPSLLDWFGPWPWYWLGLIGVGLITFLVLYMPFLIADLIRRRRDGNSRGPAPIT